MSLYTLLTWWNIRIDVTRNPLKWGLAMGESVGLSPLAKANIYCTASQIIRAGY